MTTNPKTKMTTNPKTKNFDRNAAEPNKGEASDWDENSTVDTFFDTPMRKDLRRAAGLMGVNEARFLVSAYYDWQHMRISADNQVRSLTKAGEPCDALQMMASQSRIMEKQVGTSLDVFVNNHPMGSWLLDVKGIGPVIAAGLLASIDMDRAPTVGHLWSYAGLVDAIKWEKGQKRPYDASMKTLVAFKIGESFVKQQSREGAKYGDIFRRRKQWEWEKNLRGGNAAEAARKLVVQNYSKTTDTYAWMSGRVGNEIHDEVTLLKAFEAGLADKLGMKDARVRAQYLAMLPEPGRQERVTLRMRSSPHMQATADEPLFRLTARHRETGEYHHLVSDIRTDAITRQVRFFWRLLAMQKPNLTKTDHDAWSAAAASFVGRSTRGDNIVKRFLDDWKITSEKLDEGQMERLHYVEKTEVTADNRAMLSPSHVHNRARRYTVKVFLDDFHRAWHTQKFGSPPRDSYAAGVLGRDDFTKAEYEG